MLDNVLGLARRRPKRLLEAKMFTAFFANAGIGGPRLRLDVPALGARDRYGILI